LTSSSDAIVDQLAKPHRSLLGAAALGRVLGCHALEHCHKLLGEGCEARLREDDFLGDVLHGDADGRVADEGRLAGQHVVQRYAKAVDVALVGDFFCLGLFGLM
jgi:hypothetical protein